MLSNQLSATDVSLHDCFCGFHGLLVSLGELQCKYNNSWFSQAQWWFSAVISAWGSGVYDSCACAEQLCYGVLKTPLTCICQKKQWWAQPETGQLMNVVNIWASSNRFVAMIRGRTGFNGRCTAFKPFYPPRLNIQMCSFLGRVLGLRAALIFIEKII